MTFEDFIAANTTAGVPQGWNGALYASGSSDTSSNGLFPDYGVDDTGATQYAFAAGSFQGGMSGYWGYVGQWILAGALSDQATVGQLDANGCGFPNFYYSDQSDVYTNVLFISESQGSGIAGYNGVLWDCSLNSIANVSNGTYFDYGTGDNRYFAYGYWLSGGVSSGHFTNGLPDSYTGSDWDAESMGTLQILFINGAFLTYGPFIWSDGYHGYDYLGPVADYYANLDGSVVRMVVNQSIVLGFYSQVWYGPSDFIGAAWDYNDGRYYFRDAVGTVINPNNGESPNNSYQVMDLPHPSDVRAGVFYGQSLAYAGTMPPPSDILGAGLL